jgi:hypothetical protein
MIRESARKAANKKMKWRSANCPLLFAFLRGQFLLNARNEFGYGRRLRPEDWRTIVLPARQMVAALQVGGGARLDQ